MEEENKAAEQAGGMDEQSSEQQATDQVQEEVSEKAEEAVEEKKEECAGCEHEEQK